MPGPGGGPHLCQLPGLAFPTAWHVQGRWPTRARHRAEGVPPGHDWHPRRRDAEDPPVPLLWEPRPDRILHPTQPRRGRLRGTKDLQDREHAPGLGPRRRSREDLPNGRQRPGGGQPALSTDFGGDNWGLGRLPHASLPRGLRLLGDRPGPRPAGEHQAARAPYAPRRPGRRAPHVGPARADPHAEPV